MYHCQGLLGWIFWFWLRRIFVAFFLNPQPKKNDYVNRRNLSLGCRKCTFRAIVPSLPLILSIIAKNPPCVWCLARKLYTLNLQQYQGVHPLRRQTKQGAHLNWNSDRKILNRLYVLFLFSVFDSNLARCRIIKKPHRQRDLIGSNLTAEKR